MAPSPPLDQDVWELYGPDDWTQSRRPRRRAAREAGRAAAPVPHRGDEVRRPAPRRPPYRALQPRPRRAPAARARQPPGAVRRHGTADRELGGRAQEQVARRDGADRGPRWRRGGGHRRSGRRLRRLEHLPQGRPAGLLLQPLRPAALQGPRRDPRLPPASTRCGWSSPTTAGAWGRAEPSTLYLDGARSAKAVSTPPCRCSSPLTRPPTSAPTAERP